jgi:hypothetical protein
MYLKFKACPVIEGGEYGYPLVNMDRVISIVPVLAGAFGDAETAAREAGAKSSIDIGSGYYYVTATIDEIDAALGGVKEIW